MEKRLKSHHDATRPLRNEFIADSDEKQYLRKLLNIGQKEEPIHPSAVYIHVPYCSNNCSYCNLIKEQANEKTNNYHDFLIWQIKTVASYNYIRQSKFDSVYFGGGTPTVLSSQQLTDILQAIHSHLPLTENVEISVESNLSNLSREKLSIFADFGVNRLSLGVQTFSNSGREILGRRGKGSFARRKVREIMDAGFDNTGIDLIYNYPGQTKSELKKDLEIIRELNVAGLSFYSLILHEDTKIYQKIKEAKYLAPDNQTGKEFFNIIMERMFEAGYDFFELTRLVKNERDNYRYIKIKHEAGDCLPIGVGAGGRLGNYLYFNPNKMSLKQNPYPGIAPGRLVQDKYNAVYRVLGRLQLGEIDLKFVEKYLKKSAKNSLQQFIFRLQKQGLVEKNNEKYKLTLQGIFWGNNIGRELVKRLIDNIN